MKNISIYTRSGNISPSSYYRILQFAEELDCNVKYREVVPNKIYETYNKSTGIKRKVYQVFFYAAAYFRLIGFLSADIKNKPDTVFVSRAIMPRIMVYPIANLIEKMVCSAGQVIWDIDDNIFECGEITSKESDILLKGSKKIIVIGEYLKSLIPDEYQGKIMFLPTTDGDYQDEDIDKVLTAREKRYDSGEIALLWLATYTSLPFLEDVVPFLDRAAKTVKEKYGKRLILEVVCNRPLNMKTDNLEIVNYTWTKELAREKMLGAHIGIMPTRYTKQTLGKGGFKMIQYMSAGLPTLASAVGYADEIMIDRETGISISYNDLSEWESAAVELCESWEKIRYMGIKARERWDSDYSYRANLRKLYALVNGGETDESK